MDLPEMQQFLTNQGVVTGVRVSDTNANELAKAFGGVAVLDDEYNFVLLRLPTLYGNIEIGLGEYLIRETNTGRLSSMSEQKFKQTYFTEADTDLLKAVQTAEQIRKDGEELEKQRLVVEENQARLESEARFEAMRNHPSSYPNPVRGTDLYAERQKNLSGDSD